MISHGEGFRGWLENKLVEKVAADAQFLGRLVDGQPVAAIAFSNWTGEDIEIAVAAEPGSGTIGLVRSVFDYVFQQLQCVRCTIKIRDDNAKSLRLAKRLGFVYEGRMRHGKAGHDLLIYGLLRQDYDRKRTQTANPS